MIHHQTIGVKELTDIKAKIESDTSMVVHKCIAALPTGDEILTNVDLAISSRTVNTALGASLETIKTQYLALPLCEC